MLAGGNYAGRVYGLDSGVSETSVRFVTKGTGDLHNASDAYLMHGISNGTTRFVFGANGNIGIGGTEIPNSTIDIISPQFDISGNINASTANQNSGITVQANAGDAAGAAGAGIRFAQRWYSGSTHNIVTAGIFGYKRNSSGNFGGGLKIATSTGTAANLSTRMTIDDSGKVGIGSALPEQRLTVSGVTDITHYNNSTINNDRLQLGFNAPEGYLKTKNSSGSPASNLAFYTTDSSGNTNKRMHLTYDGNVGIGTDDPGAKLEVRDGSSQGIIIRSDNTQSTDTNKALRVRNNSDTNTFHVSHKGQGYFAGKVGIGTISPTHFLSSFGSGNNGGVRIENTHDTTTVSGNTASGSFPHNLVLSNYESQNAGSANRMASLGFDIPTPGGSHANATIAYQATNSSGNGDLQFWLEQNNTPYERLRIASDGKIGVNNNAPLYALHFKNAMASTPSYIHMEVTGTNTVGGGAGIQFDTSASNNSSNNGLYLAQISGERSSSDDGSNSLVFKTSRAGANGDDALLHGPGTRMTIDENGNLILGDFATVDTRNTGGIHIRDSKGISFKSNSSQSVSRNWRIRNDDYGWGNLDFSVGDSVSDWGDSAADVLLSLTSNRRVGINATVPQQKLDVVGFGFTSAVFRPDTSAASVYGNTGSVNNLIQLRMPYGASASNTSNSGARWGIKFQGRNDGAGYTNDDKSASIYAVSEDSLGYNRRVGLAFYTSSFDADQVERLRISNTGAIIKGSSNSANSQQPVQLFFNKRGSQIGKRVHHGSGSSSTTHNLLTISSWQSSNTRLFAYVTVHYVNPVANLGGRMETYAAANYGGTRNVGTFTVADGGRWGNPSGTLSLQWSGNTLQINTFNNAYMEYSVDITYVAYDGAVVVFS